MRGQRRCSDPRSTSHSAGTRPRNLPRRLPRVVCDPREQLRTDRAAHDPDQPIGIRVDDRRRRERPGRRLEHPPRQSDLDLGTSMRGSRASCLQVRQVALEGLVHLCEVGADEPCRRRIRGAPRRWGRGPMGRADRRPTLRWSSSWPRTSRRSLRTGFRFRARSLLRGWTRAAGWTR